jgi:hypothetical protein
MISVNFLPKEPVPPVTSTLKPDQFIFHSFQCRKRFKAADVAQ